MIDYETFVQNAKQLQERIAIACEGCGRNPSEVTLLPVTKTHPARAVDYAAIYGFKAVGENRVQEAVEKRKAITTVIGWELIGHLQSNKAKQAVTCFDRIQSVDSIKLIHRLGKLVADRPEPLALMLQVNTAVDPAKYGVRCEETDKLAEAVLGYPKLKLEGLMTLGALRASRKETSATFERLRQTRERLGKAFGLSLPELSMGMSGDLEEALRAGSTLVRIGTALFGERMEGPQVRVSKVSKKPQDDNLATLRQWHFPGTALAVIGDPIKHSLSPHLHNAALQAMASKEPRFKNWRYFKFKIAPDELSEALPLLHTKGFRGLNLTLPHKVTVLPQLATISPTARRMGAVNTLVWQPKGYDGHNTDGYGLAKALGQTLDVALKNATVVLLGAGGAARAAAVQCLEQGCSQLWIGNRNRERLLALVDTLAAIAGSKRVHPFELTLPLPEQLPSTGVLIHATSLGLQPDDPVPIDLTHFEASLKVYDMIYGPQQTPLLRKAQARGMAVANGLSMLLYQGLRSLELWSGCRTIPIEAMQRALNTALHKGDCSHHPYSHQDGGASECSSKTHGRSEHGIL